jgi:hypothetical protein
VARIVVMCKLGDQARKVTAGACLVLMILGSSLAVGAAETNQAFTEMIDPKEMERAKVVEKPGPLEAGIVGKWELWVPGGVWYSSDGRSVYQKYTPGAALNRLVIAADGTYQWAQQKGRVVEVRPWHAQPERRYYRVVQAGGAEYDFYLDAKQDKLVLLFGGVGGHAASGTREKIAKSPEPKPAKEAKAELVAGAKVEVLWGGRWYPAKVLKVESEKYYIHYEGWDSSWDEWVKPERVRAQKQNARP